MLGPEEIQNMGAAAARQQAALAAWEADFALQLQVLSTVRRERSHECVCVCVCVCVDKAVIPYRPLYVV